MVRNIAAVMGSQRAVAFACALFLSGFGSAPAAVGSAQGKAPPAATNPWAYSVTLDGYFAADETNYATPIFTADRSWLHLEGRYNYENLDTASVWAGYNFSAGKKLLLNVTPMIGGVFGRTTGIAPGCEASLAYKKIDLSISNEYVYNPSHKSENFYYSWLQLTYSPANWLDFGAVTQHTKAFGSSLYVQPGAFLGVSHKQWQFTTYVFSGSFTNPTVILEAGYEFPGAAP
ncbi:MAG: hypothetical protein ACLQPV_05945 [Vulcanimicrobiaceae bacterium]